MDINDIRTALTVIMFLMFLGIVAWAWSGRQKARFDRAAHSVLNEDDEDDRPHGGRPETKGA